MKKLILLILCTISVLPLCACGKTSNEFEVSKVAYDEINKAYEITEKFGSDIYDSWLIGIYDKDEILEDGVSYLASNLYLSEDEIKDGVAYIICEFDGKDWNTISDEDKQKMRDDSVANGVFSVFEDDLFSFCVLVTSKAYIANGKAEEVENYLAEAKSQMKELSEKYSDYEHYPNLKGFFTTTSSFFDFCKNPTGSFEQVKDTINNYKNEVRDYKNDLDYIFED